MLDFSVTQNESECRKGVCEGDNNIINGDIIERKCDKLGGTW